MKNIKEFMPLIKLLSKEKFRLIIASTIIFLSGLSQILTGYLNGAAVESITQLEIKKAIIYLAIYFILELTFDGYFLYYAKSMLQKIESSMSRKLEYNTYSKTIDLPAVAFEKYSSGEMINRVTYDANTLSFLFERILNVISSILASFIIMIYILINSWIIGVYIITIVIILFMVIKKYNPKLRDIHKERKQEQDKFTSLTTETIRGIREIKTLGIKNRLKENMMNIMKNMYKKSTNEIDIQKRFNNTTSIIKSFLEVGTFIICIILLYKSQITLTFFISMTYYVYRYMWLIENINDLTQNYQRIVVSLGRVNEILENKLYQDETFGKNSIKEIKGTIEFKNVTFAYPEEGNTLSKFNLTIEPNQKVAIVGKSGQGKSTIFNLITRIFDIKSGEILIDGINIKDLDEETLRKFISVIRQEPFIFNRSIKENFKVINDKISLKQIRNYTKMAYLDDYIMSLPKKYNTILGEGGVNLSGGQKQRLSIARTLSKKSKIILFDEATSALDNESQEYIKKSIDNLSKDHTVIIVAHRLSTIVDADIIHVIDKGKVIASGTHQELLNTNKVYQNLYTKESLNS